MGERPLAALLQGLSEVDPLACPTWHSAMRIIAFIKPRSVIDQMLTRRRTRATRAPHLPADAPPPAAGLHSAT